MKGITNFFRKIIADYYYQSETALIHIIGINHSSIIHHPELYTIRYFNIKNSKN